MKDLNEMTQQEQDEVLKLAIRIKSNRERERKFQSLEDSRTLMIRWDVTYSKYGNSYFSVSVELDEVKELVKSKIYEEGNENK